MRLRPRIEAAIELDKRVTPARRDLAALQPVMFNWSRTVREVVGLPLSTLAQRLNISKQAASKLELNEQRGAISLASLEAIAEALDCDLVYGFIPRKSFTEAAQRLQAQQDVARKSKRKIRAPE